MEERLHSVYSHLSYIKDEIKKRKNDSVLHQKVKDFFGDYYLHEFDGNPKAVIARSIITPNKELEYFLDLATSSNLEPLFLEYDNKFVAKNIEKYYLCRLFFSNKAARHRFEISKIVDFNKWEGKQLHSIETIKGHNLKDVHRNLFQKKFPQHKHTTVDITEWFNKTRELDETYYFFFLSLFIVNGVLFDNFISENADEREFFEKKVYPAFIKVTNYFGVKPLIYPLLPFGEENRHEWLYYDNSLKEVL
jgi:hypothetical protein